MTTKTNRIEEIFRDARELQADALEMLDQRKIRNAAEKARGATKRATVSYIQTAEELSGGAYLAIGYCTESGR